MLITAAVVASLLLAVVLAVTASGEAALGRPPSWIPTAAATAAVVLAALPAAFAVRRRHGIGTPERGLDAVLRAITAYRIVRTLAAVLAAEAGGLLITASPASDDGSRKPCVVVRDTEPGPLRGKNCPGRYGRLDWTREHPYAL
ncbi:hypothetical protein B1A87_001945 [Arthrobacter sp. KBS0703]|uniref:hypothetical protein n=1 Tax=Arthrobacter sp. KBS0703 TaxID=1955698 RepID=UPI00098EDA9A|nr:hypothetical protein [Arthrobacter sp. KBS0703]TSE14863.1 hypothetical protein B1A87_001945 [Arthrobacter sp. KBS0703]